ncbi:pectin lyase-like protein [Aspergillus floccosus]
MSEKTTDIDFWALTPAPGVLDCDTDDTWSPVSVYAIDVASVNTMSNTFDPHTVAVSSVDINGPTRVKVTYTKDHVISAVIRPISRGIAPHVNGNRVIFNLEQGQDMMLELNSSKWNALHLLANNVDPNAPTKDTDEVWFFGPGVNQGSAFALVTDGANLMVPSNKTVYIASGAFVTIRLNFVEVDNSAVRGHGFILPPNGGYTHRELGGAIYMSKSSRILVEGVTSLGANGFTLSAGECNNIIVNGYRSFSSAGNGDGIDFFCSSDIKIENCFLRNSDDNIALYSHRWDWYGHSRNIIIQNCVLLPDVAHAINMGTHGNPNSPETTSSVTIRNIDILDHDEKQLWYQGCIAINAADMNLFEDIHIEDVRCERISTGQLLNIRVMQNKMWSSAPGRGIRNISFRNLSLDNHNSGTINPSQLLGYDETRRIENVTFENLRIGDRVIHDNMEKPRWYLVSDFVPLFVNEHVENIKFCESIS